VLSPRLGLRSSPTCESKRALSAERRRAVALDTTSVTAIVAATSSARDGRHHRRRCAFSFLGDGGGEGARAVALALSAGGGDVTLSAAPMRAFMVTLRARWVTLRARWRPLRALRALLPATTCKRTPSPVLTVVRTALPVSGA
jgi:hypothetical protein